MNQRILILDPAGNLGTIQLPLVMVITKRQWIKPLTVPGVLLGAYCFSHSSY